MDKLLRLNELIIVDTHLLLKGDTALSICIFSYVQTFIRDTRTFSY